MASRNAVCDGFLREIRTGFCCHLGKASRTVDLRQLSHGDVVQRGWIKTEGFLQREARAGLDVYLEGLSIGICAGFFALPERPRPHRQPGAKPLQWAG